MSLAWLEPDWPAPPGVRAISTFRCGGVSDARFDSLNLADHVGDAVQAVAENRRRLRSAAGLPTEPIWLEQIHGVRVADLDAEAAPTAADGSFTRQPGRLCAILTADCLPVLLTDDTGTTVGAAHAGWRGLAAGVIEATVRAMGVPPSGMLAWLGPAIGVGHFEVGGEVRQAFLAQDGGAEDAFTCNSRGRYWADLALLARRRLATLGLTRVYASAECTYREKERFFSHRRDGTTGRQASLIWLESG